MKVLQGRLPRHGARVADARRLGVPEAFEISGRPLRLLVRSVARRLSRHPERALTRLHVSVNWVYATTGFSVTHLWHRDHVFFDVDIERRRITVTSGDGETVLSAEYLSRRQLRQLHSTL